jgi:DNA-binding NarL/FixJ family response regulator
MSKGWSQNRCKGNRTRIGPPSPTMVCQGSRRLLHPAASHSAIRRVMAGERVVDPDLALTALSDGDNPLTRREREVLRAALEGASIADIATRLYLSEGTVRNHLSTAIQKLKVQNRMEAARLAQDKGWL